MQQQSNSVPQQQQKQQYARRQRQQRRRQRQLIFFPMFIYMNMCVVCIAIAKKQNRIIYMCVEVVLVVVRRVCVE